MHVSWFYYQQRQQRQQHQIHQPPHPQQYHQAQAINHIPLDSNHIPLTKRQRVTTHTHSNTQDMYLSYFRFGWLMIK